MNIKIEPATSLDIPQIWKVLQDAIERRKEDGSNQWQDGYPNVQTIESDIQKGVAFVLKVSDLVVGYCAILMNDEPEYLNIEGEWLTNEDFIVFHRLAISGEYAGKGLSKKIMSFIEEYAIENNIFSIKADTNFDNQAMTKVFESLGYSFCGKVYFRGSPRNAYEKVLVKTK